MIIDIVLLFMFLISDSQREPIRLFTLWLMIAFFVGLIVVGILYLLSELENWYWDYKLKNLDKEIKELERLRK